MLSKWFSRKPATTPATRPTEGIPQMPEEPVSAPVASVAPGRVDRRLVETETTIDLPWLAAIDKEMARHGYGGHIIKATAPPGAAVFVDPEYQQARILHPEGVVQAWTGLAQLRIDPGEPSWSMTWQMPPSFNEITLKFEPADDDENEVAGHPSIQVYSDGFEGHEATLFPEFIKAVGNPDLNPHGFSLPDGVYRQAGGSVVFDVRFGADGGNPAFLAQPDTLPAELTYPFITDISVKAPLSFEVRQERVDVAPGFYRATVTAFNVHTGDVIRMRCKGMEGLPPFQIDGERLTGFIHEGTVEIMKIIQDRRPNF
jgi:hypothetical protein